MKFTVPLLFCERVPKSTSVPWSVAVYVGTILFGEEAVKMGIIDEVGSLSDALEKLYSMIGEEDCAKKDSSEV